MASLRTSLIAIFSRRPLPLCSAPRPLGRTFSTHETTAPTSETDKREHAGNGTRSESSRSPAEADDKASASPSSSSSASPRLHEASTTSIPFLDDSCSPSYICDPGASHKTEIHCARECEAPVEDEETAKETVKAERPPGAQ